jgi:hypothetical protein
MNKALLKSLKQAVRYIEVTNAYRGAMTAAEVEAAIKRNINDSRVEIGANSCTTLDSFDIHAAKAAIKLAEEV